jgi:hypothetical protein
MMDALLNALCHPGTAVAWFANRANLPAISGASHPGERIRSLAGCNFRQMNFMTIRFSNIVLAARHLFVRPLAKGCVCPCKTAIRKAAHTFTEFTFEPAMMP